MPTSKKGEKQSEGRRVGGAFWTRPPERRLALATVPDCHFRTGSGSKPNRCQIGGPGHQ